MVLCPGAEPISYRSWTTQESLLSTRLLIYGRLQLFWLCRCKFASDGGYMDWNDFASHAAWLRLQIEDNDNVVDEDEIALQNELHLDLPPGCASYSKIHQEWTRIVNSYSGRLLTYNTDKLPALSAIAALFQEKLNDEYICGLWRLAVLFDLMWVPAKRWIEKKHNENDYIGPSWSWISYPDLVRYVGRWGDHHEIAKVVSFSATPTYSFAPFGQILPDAELTLEAPLLHGVKLARTEKDTATDGGYPIHLPTALPSATSSEPNQCTLIGTFHPDYPHILQSLDSSPDPTLYCLILHGSPHPNGLVLIPYTPVTGINSINGNHNRFQRIGTFEQYSHKLRNANMLQFDGCGCSHEKLDDRAKEKEDEDLERYLTVLLQRRIVVLV
ncbi:putative heterokaryon incompatibility [Phaeomoniella chlamydospora]|uniref:Putative heterokaryon incompatibility n=1 Tax=Phaeomoniella chlamydospora TaxID=158046 RepID=A0A0G2ECZ2_PHACM|nr:putative heterokaryon incompatibility [Phaeomoniella chlamydospora]